MRGMSQKVEMSCLLMSIIVTSQRGVNDDAVNTYIQGRRGLCVVLVAFSKHTNVFWLLDQSSGETLLKGSRVQADDDKKNDKKKLSRRNQIKSPVLSSNSNDPWTKSNMGEWGGGVAWNIYGKSKGL